MVNEFFNLDEDFVEAEIKEQKMKKFIDGLYLDIIEEENEELNQLSIINEIGDRYEW